MSTPHPWSFKLRWKHKKSGNALLENGFSDVRRVSNMLTYEIGDSLRGPGIPPGAFVAFIETGTINITNGVASGTIGLSLSNLQVGDTLWSSDPDAPIVQGTTILAIDHGLGTFTMDDAALRTGTFPVTGSYIFMGNGPASWTPATVLTKTVEINNDGYYCPYGSGPTGAGRPWSIALYGGIPSRVNAGNSAINQGLNVSYNAFQNLHRGGMGASNGSDQSRYRYAIGLYTGDDDEISLQPQPEQLFYEHCTGTTTNGNALITNVGNTQMFTVGQLVYGDNLPADGVALQSIGVNQLTLASGTGVTAAAAGWLRTTVLPPDFSIRQMLSWLDPVRTVLAAPGAPTVINEEEGAYESNTAANRYYYITALSKDGAESLPSPASVAVPFDANSVPPVKGVLLNWTAVTSAVAYNVYRGTTNVSTTGRLVGTVAASTTATWTDGNDYRYYDTWNPGAALSSTAPPTATDIRGRPVATANALVLLFASSDTNNGGLGMTVVYRSLRTDETRFRAINMSKWDAPSTQTYWHTGPLAKDAATVYQNRVFVPMQTTAGDRDMVVLLYDTSAAAGQEYQWKNLTGFDATRAFADSNRRLWYWLGNVAYWTTDPLAPNPTWNGPVYVGQPQYHVNSAAIYGGAQGDDSALFMAKGDGLFRILNTADGPAAFAEKVGTLGPDFGYNGSFMVEHRGELLIGAREQVLRFSLARIDATDPNLDDGLPIKMLGYCEHGVSTGRHFYLLYVNPNNALPTGTNGLQQILETKEGGSWHQVAHSYSGEMADWDDNSVTAPLAAEDAWTGRVMHIVSGGDYLDNQPCDFLYFAGGAPAGTPSTSVVGGSELYRIPVRWGVGKLRETLEYIPVNQGLIRFPPYSTAEAAVDKIWHWLEITQSEETTLDTNAMLHMYGRTTDGSYPAASLGLVAYRSPVGGRFFPDDEDDRAFLPPPDDDDVALSGANWVSKALDLQMVLGCDGVNVTPVISDVIITSSPTNESLRRWTFNVEMGMSQSLDDTASPYYTSTEAMYQAYQQLLQYAQNDSAIVLTDPWGDQAVVRIDLNPLSADEWRQVDETTYYPESVSVTVVATELYPLSS